MGVKWNVPYSGSRIWRFLIFVEPLSKWTCSMGPAAVSLPMISASLYT